MRALLLTAALLCTGYLAAGALAHSNHGGKLSASNAWARATTSTAKTGAAYVTLVNRGKVSDRLVAALSPIASRVEFHVSTMKDGLMSMQRVESVEVPPGEPTVLKPGGIHLMLFGLVKPLREGDEIAFILKFEHAGLVRANATVLGIGSMGPEN